MHLSRPTMAIGAGMLAFAAAMPAMAASAATTTAPAYTNFAAQATRCPRPVDLPVLELRPLLSPVLLRALKT
jgi:hypothetical protein